MLRQIILDGNTIEYELTRKRVRNINLRINPDGSVKVSCPSRTSIAEVEHFLRMETAFILRSLAKVSSRIDNAARPSTYEDGEQVKVFGEMCTLHVSPGFPFKGVRYSYPDIYVNSDSPEKTQRLYEKWKKQKLRDKIIEMLEYYVPKFELKGVSAPEQLSFRTMSSRWGVCSPSTGKMTFNYNLFEAPEELIAYIVVHEMAHFLEPNHSERFWAHVEDVMPDYKARRKLLREY